MPYTMTRVGFQIGGTLTRKVAWRAHPIFKPLFEKSWPSLNFMLYLKPTRSFTFIKLPLGCKRIDPLCRKRSICRVIAIYSLEIRNCHCAIERCPAVHTYHIYNQHWRQRLKPLLRSFQVWEKVYILQKFTRFGTNCAELIHSTSLG